jgi:ribosomal protein L20
MNKGKIFKLAKGFRGRAKNCIRIARERVEKALQYSYRDRRNKKRDMRSLWIERINAGTRLHGVCIVYNWGSFSILGPKSLFMVTLKQTILRRHQLCSSHASRMGCQSFGIFRNLSSAVPMLIIVPWLFVQVNYGNFMHGLMKENIQLNRKVLSELSMHEPYSFKALVDVSRNAFPGNRPVPAKEGLASIL